MKPKELFERLSRTDHWKLAVEGARRIGMHPRDVAQSLIDESTAEGVTYIAECVKNERAECERIIAGILGYA